MYIEQFRTRKWASLSSATLSISVDPSTFASIRVLMICPTRSSSFEKFTYYNSRKGFVDTDNYFKDPWNQRDINDYIRYMHMPPTMTIMHPMEANTIYDPNRN